MAQAMSKHDKTFTVTILRSVCHADISQCICGSSVRFHSEIFHSKSNEFIGRRTDHGKKLSRPVDLWVAFGDRATAFKQHRPSLGRDLMRERTCTFAHPRWRTAKAERKHGGISPI